MHEKKARVGGGSQVREHFIESYNINMMQEYHRYWVKKFIYKAGFWKIYFGEVQFYSLFLSLKHNLYLGLVTSFYQVPLLNHITFLSFALVTLSSFMDIAK